MSMSSICAAAALVLALAVPVDAQKGTPPSPNMPPPAGLPETDQPVGTGGELAGEEARPDINPAIPLLVIVSAAAIGLGIRAAVRRSRA